MCKPFLYFFLFISIICFPEYSIGQVLDFRYEQFDTDDGLPSSEIYDLIEDSMGNIWLTTDRGVVKYDGYDFITYDMNTGLANMVNFGFQLTGDDTFWVNGLDGSFSFWDGNSFVPFAFNSVLKDLRPSEKSWFDFLGTKDNLLFFHVLFSNNPEITFPIYSINIYTGIINEHKEDFGDSLMKLKYTDQLIRRRINVVKNRKTIEDSIAKYNRGSISKTHFQWDSLNRLRRTRLLGARITGLYVDRNGGEWVSTKSGIYYFKNGDLSLEPEIFFNGVSVTSISENRDGSLWVTSTDNGLFHIPNIKILKYSPNGWAEGESVYKLKILNGKLLAKSEKNQVFILNRDEANLFHYYDETNLGKGPNITLNNYYYDIHLFPLENGNFLKHNSDGFNILSNSFKSITPAYKFRALSVTKDVKNNLWIASTEGLFKWMPDYINTSPEVIPIKGYKALRINDVKTDRDGIWAVTPKFGLVYKTESSEYILKHEKLKNKTLQCIYKQNDTTLWVGSNRGLHKIKYKFDNKIPRIEKLEVFTINQGLISNFINDISFWNDEIWLATDEGLCHFKPDDLTQISTVPSIKINYLEADTEKWANIDQVILNHDKNDISISYTGVSYNKPKNGFYQYKINDEPWTETNERKVSFLNLNHGTYKFSVKCRSDSDVWSTTKSFTFTIKPHLFEQSWFRVSVIFLLCVFIFLFIILYRKGWKKKLENENRLRKSELTTLLNQMNPHFMFNSLTNIQGLIHKGNKHEANTYIGNFSRLIRKSLEYSKLEKISLEDEVLFIENYLELEKKRFKKLFEYHVWVDPELVKNSLQVPPLLIQPLLENSIKHGFRDLKKKGEIEIAIKKYSVNEVFEVIIKDNGIGLNLSRMSHPNGSMGLGIVKDRIDLIRENSKVKEVSFYIESEIGKGTIIRLLLPLNS